MSKHRSPAIAFAAALSLWFSVLPSRAQSDPVILSAAEFQRMVYSSHLMTQLDERPELDASLQVLLELQRRNPNADPAAVAGVLREATARYRTNAPAYIRTIGYRDEILAAYLDTLRQVPARTNLVLPNLSLLNHFMLRPEDYATASSAELINGGNQRLLNAEDAPAQREALVDACTLRGAGNPRFGLAMDALLSPEIGVLRAHTANQILSVNPALNNSPTMQAMLASSLTNGGSVALSTNDLKNLFTLEMARMHEIINTNRAVHLEILQTQIDAASYLTNTALILANQQREAAVSQGQVQRLAAASASVNNVSRLTASKLPAVGSAMGGLGKGVKAIADGTKILNDKGGWSAASKLGKAAATGSFIAGGLMIVGATLEIAGLFNQPGDPVLQEIGEVKSMIGDLSTNINYRFDQVGQDLNQVLNQLQTSINLIGQVGQDVTTVRQGLVDIQTDLHRLERHLQVYVTQLYNRGLNNAFNLDIGYESTHSGDLMTTNEYNSAEALFFTHAVNNSVDNLSSPYAPPRVYTAAALYSELSESGGGTTNRLDQNLSYIKKYLNDVHGQSTGGTLGQLANPRDWFVGAYAYLQLALENPRYFRKINPLNRLDLISARGRDLTNFFRSLTFTGTTGTNINWSLFSALTNNYNSKLASFTNQVHLTNLNYAAGNNFAVDLWHQWFVNAPRVTTTGTEMRSAPQPPPTMPRFWEDTATQISAGVWHHLALKPYAYPTVVGWGDTNAGPIPSDLGFDVDQISAGGFHGLARKTDGTVRAWGSDFYGQTDIPPAAQRNVSRVAGGGYHSLALKNDGTVVAWGDNALGQTNTAFLNNVAKIAAGAFHNLAIKTDASVVAWGYNVFNQTNVPVGLRALEVAGGEWHSLALTTNYAVVAWGYNGYGQTTIPPGATNNVVAIATAGQHCLALRLDGTIIAWGSNDRGQSTVPPGLTGVVAIAAGYSDSLALKSDGTIMAWGDNTYRQSLVPPAVTWRGRIAAGANNILALKSDGTLAGWGAGSAVPSITNVVATAGGGNHSLALQRDGVVRTWGNFSYGLANIPARATNVVAIAAGDNISLALKSDGTVIGWGDNSYGATNPVTLAYPSGLTNMVAIAAGRWHGLALSASGLVEGWGAGYFGAGGLLPPPHYGQAYVAFVNVAGNRIVQIAAGAYHSLALRQDGTVFGWGLNLYGQTTGVPNNVPPNDTTGIVMRFGQPLSNIVAIAAGENHSLALKADGQVIGWGAGQNDYPSGYPHYGQTDIPAEVYGVVAIAAGGNLSAALRNDGTIIVWGQNDSRRVVAPPGMSDAVAVAAGGNHSLVLTPYMGGTVRGLGANTQRQANGEYFYASGNFVTLSGQLLTNIVAIAAGNTHSLALQTGGAVYGWGENQYGQGNGYFPEAGPVYVAGQPLIHAVAIAAGRNHSLALKADGRVVGWGLTNSGQVNIPPGATNSVVAIAAGGDQSLALKADGTVVTWGFPQTSSAGLSNVVAIAAGASYSLALKADGTVFGLGINTAGLSNVVAIAAGDTYVLALKADGTVVGLGGNGYGANNTAGLSNVVAMSAGSGHSLFLTSGSDPYASPMWFVHAQIPARVRTLLASANQQVITEIGSAGSINRTGTELSGAKALMQAVLELGMPYTMERDDVLHGFFYGSEPLVDLNNAQTLLEAENQQLLSSSGTLPHGLAETAVIRHGLFAQRLNQSLLNLQTNGQPEIPRLVGHTLRLLSLLRDSAATVPPSALETSRATNSLVLVLHGEPYVRYTVQQSSNLANPTSWINTSIADLRSADSPLGIVTTILPTTGQPARYYRAAQPVP